MHRSTLSSCGSPATSGDGIQLAGNRFAAVTALAGNDLATFPDFPAEIRAPVGTTYGVSAFQINFGARAIKTSGDSPDVLVALNPAALKVELPRTKPGGIVIVDTGSFTERNLRKAGYAADPLADDSLADYRIIAIDVSKLTLEAAKPFGVSQHDALALQELLGDRPDLLDVRSRSGIHRKLVEEAVYRRTDYRAGKYRRT